MDYTKLERLFRDLVALNISNYLDSSAFELRCVKYNLWEIWQQALESFEKEVGVNFFKTSVSEQNIGALKNLILKHSTPISDFTHITNTILSGFIEFLDELCSFDNVFQDLASIGFNQKELIKLRGQHEKRQQKIAACKLPQDKYPLKSLKISPLLNSQKNAWIDMIANAELDSVIASLLEYAQTNSAHHTDLLKMIINLSSQWQRLKDSQRKGIAHQDEINININKINNSLLDLIQNF